MSALPAKTGKSSVPAKPPPMKLFKATSAAMNYTYGPALVYRGPGSIDKIYHRGEPVVVIADLIPMDEMRKLELTRIRGFVFEGGSAVEDDDLYNFLMVEKRAAVIACEHALAHIRDEDMVIVDGVTGYVCANPDEATLAEFQRTRSLGPPDEKGAAVQSMARAILEGLVKEREAKEKAGEKIVKSGEVMTVAEAKAASAAQPGLIYQLLTGIPLPNSPTADHHGHDHPPGDAHGHDDHDHAHDAKDARSARDEAKAAREERKAAREETRSAREEPKPAKAEEAKPAAKEEADAPLDRKAQIEAARAARRGEAPAKPAEKAEAEKPAAPAPAPAAATPEPAAVTADATDEDPLGYQT